jgi:hypothetical protein
MEIDAAMKKKFELEEKILDLIDRFETDTGLSCGYIRIDSVPIVGRSKPKIYSVQIEITL